MVPWEFPGSSVVRTLHVMWPEKFQNGPLAQICICIKELTLHFPSQATEKALV